MAHPAPSPETPPRHCEAQPKQSRQNANPDWIAASASPPRNDASKKPRKSGRALRSSAEAKHGWSPERRARQAARIRLWAPWARSTGPKTASGKAKSAANSYKHGARARDMRLISKALSTQSRFLRDVNRYISATKRYPANELLAKYSHRLALEGRMASVLLDYALRTAGFTLEWRSGHYVPRKFHQNR